ncbi:MAG: phosphoribosylanthranilate isomerase [Endomicrobium sp.]|jgi:phosphoribosylanthranilate isomerase|nr:phosphoribosylanthranilate isomerase [Endomicrobium sp.]
MAKVKISGITNYDDALDAVNLGADFLAFCFIRDCSKKISDKLAADIISKLPPFVSCVGVFNNEEEKIIAKTIKKCNLKNVQLNGNESAQFCQNIGSAYGVKVFKRIKIDDETSLPQLQSYVSNADYFIIDASYAEGEIIKHRYELISKAMDFKVPIFVCGVGVEDVKEALEKTSPYGIDAGSRLERLPKRKDYDKMNDFIRFAHGLK